MRALARVVAEDRLAAPVLNAIDQSRRNVQAAIVEHGIRRGQSQHRRFARAQRHGQERRHIVHDIEPLGIIDDGRHPDILGQPHRHDVARFFDAEAKRTGAVEFALVVLRLPLAEAIALIDHDGRIEDQARRRKSVIERCGIDERLERGARLALRLDGPIKLAGVVIVAADQRQNAAGMRIHRDQGAVDLRHLLEIVADLVAGRERRVLQPGLIVRSALALHASNRDHVADGQDVMGRFRRGADALALDARAAPKPCPTSE